MVARRSLICMADSCNGFRYVFFLTLFFLPLYFKQQIDTNYLARPLAATKFEIRISNESVFKVRYYPVGQASPVV